MATETVPPRRTVGNPPPRATASTPQKSSEKRKEAVKELLAVPLIPLSVLATADTIRSEDENAISPWLLDVEAIRSHEDALSDAVVAIADAYPQLGVMLDRIGTTAPFMGLIAVGISLGMQLAENHGVLPDALRSASPNLIPRQEFASMIHAQAAARKNNGTGTPTDS